MLGTNFILPILSFDSECAKSHTPSKTCDFDLEMSQSQITD